MVLHPNTPVATNAQPSQSADHFRADLKPAVWGAVDLGYRDGRDDSSGYSGWAVPARSLACRALSISAQSGFRYT